VGVTPQNQTVICNHQLQVAHPPGKSAADVLFKRRQVRRRGVVVRQGVRLRIHGGISDPLRAA
jgi:hypothetical protein